MNRRREALGIWLSHGPADAVTTIFSYRYSGIHKESNPIISELLLIGEYQAAAAMCLIAGLGALLWPVAADAINAPPTAARLVAAAGLLVAAGNLGVVLV